MILRLSTLGLCLAMSLPAAAGLDRHRELAESINAQAPALSRLWPGYWPESQTYVLYDQDECWLVGDTAPQGAQAVADSKLPPGLAGRSYTMPCTVGEQRDFVLKHDWGGVKAPGVRIRLSGVGKTQASGKQSLEVVNTLFHEQFHAFQDARFQKTEQGHVPASALNESLVADKLMEAGLLSQALKADEDKTRRTALLSYLSLRAARREAMPAELRRIEDVWVRTEGAAQYVGDRATALLKNRADGWRDERALRFLGIEPDTGGSTSLNDTLFRWQAYGVGAAELRLLERLGLDFPARIADGAAPADLLVEALGQPLLAPAAIRQALDGSRLAKGATRAADKLMAEERERTDAYAEFQAKRFKLILDAEAPLGNSAYFEATAMLSVDDKRTLVHKLIRLSEEAPRYALEVKKHPVLLDDGGKGRTRYQIALREPAKLEGCTLNGASGQCPAGTRLKVPGVRLELKAPSTVSVKDGQMEIRL